MCPKIICCLLGNRHDEVQLTSVNADVAGVVSHNTRRNTIEKNLKECRFDTGGAILYGARQNGVRLALQSDGEGGMAGKPFILTYTGGRQIEQDEEGMRHQAQSFDERD
jgi:hypothetical protein